MLPRNQQVPWYAEGGRGRVDNVVYYQKDGKTFMRKAPATGYNKTPTPKQAAARARFIEAHRFAQSVINDPQLKALYEKKAGWKRTAYNLAVSEFLGRQK